MGTSAKKQINKLSKFFPQFFLFLVWLVFSLPYFFKGLTPFPSRYLVYFFSPWNSYVPFLGPAKNSATPDIITQIYPWKNLVISAWSQLQIPLWNPFSLSGTTLLANYQSAPFSPFNVLFFIFPFIDAWSILILLQPLLAGIFTYLFLRSISVSKVGSLISSVSFMFCGFITGWIGYGTLGYAILFLPLSLYAIERFFQSSKKKFLVILGFTIPLSFFSGHFQISIYFFLFLVLYLIYKTLSEKEFKKGLFAFLFVFFGLLLSMPQLIPSIEAYLFSFRSGIFQKLEIIPWQYLSTLFAPDFFGNPVTGNDWFGHYAEWNGFFGLISLLLSIYAILNIKKKKVLFFLILGILSILLSYNSPLVDLMIYLKVPVLSTSAVSRIIVLFSFSFAVLSGFGYDFLLEDISKKERKKIITTLSFFVLVFLVLWGIVLGKFNLSPEHALIARQNLILPSAILFWGIVFIFFSFFSKRKWILSLLLLVIVFDLLRFSIKWTPFEEKSLVFPTTPVVSKLQDLQKDGKVLGGFGFAEVSNYFRLPSVEGYDAVYIKRYGQFIASLKDGKLSDSPRSVVSFPKDSIYASDAANLLSIDYYAHKISDGRNSWVFPFWKYPDQFNSVYKDEKYEIFENKLSFPRAFLVNKYRVEENPQGVLNLMFKNDLNLREEIILEEDIENFSPGKEKGIVKDVSFSLNEVNIKTDSKENNLLFLNNTYYNGWKATVDGKDTKIYRADFTFQAIPLERGEHLVKVYYFPESLKIGLILGLVGLVGIIFTARILAQKASSSS